MRLRRSLRSLKILDMTFAQISKARRSGEAAAHKVMGRWPSLTLPVPIKEIAVAEGCRLQAMVLEDDLSGMAFIKDGQKNIVYNVLHHNNRQRFTIAHELGHHIMHEKMLKHSVHVDKGVLRRDNISSGGFDDIEISANAFAASVLMPEHLVRKVCPASLDLEDDALVQKFARMFGVSGAAFTNRILNLSII